MYKVIRCCYISAALQNVKTHLLEYIVAVHVKPLICSFWYCGVNKNNRCIIVSLVMWLITNLFVFWFGKFKWILMFRFTSCALSPGCIYSCALNMNDGLLWIHTTENWEILLPVVYWQTTSSRNFLCPLLCNFFIFFFFLFYVRFEFTFKALYVNKNMERVMIKIWKRVKTLQINALCKNEWDLCVQVTLMKGCSSEVKL